MKASEVISRLHALIVERGDLEVRVFNENENEFDSINEIEPRRFMPHQRATDEERALLFFGIDQYAIGDYGAQLRYDGVPF